MKTCEECGWNLAGMCINPCRGDEDRPCSRWFSKKDIPIYHGLMANNKAKPQKGGGGCFITTAVCKTLGKGDACEELMKFRNFRDTYMQETAEMQAEIAEYYQIAPQICAKIDELGDPLKSQKYAEILGKSLVPAFEALNGGNNQKAHDLYKEMVLGLKKELLGIDVPSRT